MKKLFISLLLGVTLVGGLVGCGNTVSQEEYNKVVEEKETLVKNNADLIKDKQELQNENNGLNEQLKLAKEYLELDENEKVLVDQKIEEVNQATEDKIAQEKAQKEAEEQAKKEAEEKAQKEAEEQAKQQQQKYIDAENFVKQIAMSSGYDFIITRNNNQINVCYNTGDTRVSDLIKQGFSKEELITISGYDNLRTVYTEFAISMQQQLNTMYSSDIIVTSEVKFGGETCYKVDGNGNVIIDLLK